MIDCVQALPSDGPATETEPPAKRRRTEPEQTFQSMRVAEGEIKIARKHDGQFLASDSGKRYHAGKLLSLSLVREAEAPNVASRLAAIRQGLEDSNDPEGVQYLRIRSLKSSASTPVDVSIKLRRNELSEAASRIFLISNIVHALKSEEEGAVWTSIDFQLRNIGPQVVVIIRLRVHWNETQSPFGSLRSPVERISSAALIEAFLPPPSGHETRSNESWSPMDFYESAHVPSTDNDDALGIRIPDLTSELFPYQKRTLQWLLQREGVCCSPAPSGLGSVVSKLAPSDDVEPSGLFREARDLDGNSFYVSDLYQLVTRDVTPFVEAESRLKGGILAEEMGLGKTLEMIGLILLHSRAEESSDTTTANGEKLKNSGATLIVTPESLRQQWLSELGRHAPYLRVKYYNGCGKSKTVSERQERELVEELAEQDVVITTYSVLTSEVHFAEKPPDRAMRHVRQHHRPKSPLVQISWWRVCVDEAQMIENGLSNAASVARIIPRVNAWGITGTPVKSDVGDLLGLLQFLRYQPYASRPQVWQALVTKHKSLFRELFGRISLRHTKRMVRDQISLPPQKRLVITVPFTAVEETFYQDLFKEMAAACGLEVNGVPLSDDWDPDANEESMRRWLNRLRRTALHPQVEVQRARGPGHRAGPIRTVDEVLDVMIEQSEANIRGQQRAIFNGKLTMGQLMENGPRVKVALRIWEEVRDEITGIVEDCKQNLKDAIEEAKQAGGAEATNHRRESADTSDTSDDEADE